MVWGVRQVEPRPAGGALAGGTLAVRTERLAGTCLGQLGRRFTEADRSEAVAHFVLSRPAGRALLAWGVHGLGTGSAEAELGEALTGVVWSVSERLPGPAAIALAVRGGAVGAESVASAVSWELVLGDVLVRGDIERVGQRDESHDAAREEKACHGGRMRVRQTMITCD